MAAGIIKYLMSTNMAAKAKLKPSSRGIVKRSIDEYSTRICGGVLKLDFALMPVPEDGGRRHIVVNGEPVKEMPL